MIAGPKALEHIVDTVLYFEGEKYRHLKILRAQKNRFGATHEMALLEMTGEGLREVENPSAALLADRPLNVPGLRHRRGHPGHAPAPLRDPGAHEPLGLRHGQAHERGPRPQPRPAPHGGAGALGAG